MEKFLRTIARVFENDPTHPNVQEFAKFKPYFRKSCEEVFKGKSLVSKNEFFYVTFRKN